MTDISSTETEKKKKDLSTKITIDGKNEISVKILFLLTSIQVVENPAIGGDGEVGYIGDIVITTDNGKGSQLR